jgi:hypothetical protein
LDTIPLTSGVVFVPAPSHPEITVNVCTPIQMLSSALSSTLARPSVSVPRFVLFFGGSVKATPSGDVVECSEPPDTPPPERFV